MYNVNDKIKEIENIYNIFFSKCIKKNCCKQQEMCKEFSNNFLYDHGIIFSPNYFGQKHKILVVGLEKRGKMQCKSECKILDSGNNPHWKGTALEIILFNNENLTNEEMEQLENNEKMRQDKCNTSEYAFTDFYKCAFSKDEKFSGNMKHTKEMLCNCKKLFKKEIDWLSPEFIIVQGINNKDIIDYSLGSDGIEVLYDDGMEKQGIWKYTLAEREVYVLITPFPTHRTSIEYQWNNIKYDIYNMIRLCKNMIIKSRS